MIIDFTLQDLINQYSLVGIAFVIVAGACMLGRFVLYHVR